MNIRVAVLETQNHKNKQSKIAQKTGKIWKWRCGGKSLYTFSPQILWIKKVEN